MRPSRMFPLALALALAAGCNAPSTPSAPSAQTPSEPDRLAPASVLQLHDEKNGTVKVFTMRSEMIEVPVGSKAQVLEDTYTITKDPGSRLIRVKVEDGPQAGTVGHVSRAELRKIPQT